MQATVNEGRLLSDGVVLAVLRGRLEAGRAAGERGFLLDGFPRTRAQVAGAGAGAAPQTPPPLSIRFPEGREARAGPARPPAGRPAAPVGPGAAKSGARSGAAARLAPPRRAAPRRAALRFLSTRSPCRRRPAR
jgi:hypothetical protein